MRALFALSFLTAALFAPTATYGYAGEDNDAREDCYTLLHGNGDTHFMSAELGKCTNDPDPYRLAHEWLKDPQILHYIATQVRAGGRVRQLEVSLEVAADKLKAADGNMPNSMYVTRAYNDEVARLAARLSGAVVFCVMLVIALIITLAWRAEYRLRVKAERRR